ncbi:hypothetical protein [Devosia sp.]|uniref:hypothetical protein n=1 Tax=Devosia sp. TaxID=1871048 RepID=UPI003266451E
MSKTIRRLLLGVNFAVACGVGFLVLAAANIIPVFADEPGPQGFDASKLLHLGSQDFTIDSTVSTAPLGIARIKKVERGHVSYVDLITTSTGTYSTDVLTSSNVSYPGVENKHDTQAGMLSFWGPTGWMLLAHDAASSTIYLKTSTGRVISNGDVSCIIGKYSTVC